MRLMRVRHRTVGEIVTAELTEPERRTLRLLMQGMTTPQIAQRLHRSPYTVRDTLTAMMEALGLDNRVQLAIWACEHPDSIARGITVLDTVEDAERSAA